LSDERIDEFIPFWELIQKLGGAAIGAASIISPFVILLL
jgi:hypothetical protein